MGHRQKGKGKKRKKSWHRGRGEAIRWAQLSRRLRGPVVQRPKTPALQAGHMGSNPIRATDEG